MKTIKIKPAKRPDMYVFYSPDKTDYRFATKDMLETFKQDIAFKGWRAIDLDWSEYLQLKKERVEL